MSRLSNVEAVNVFFMYLLPYPMKRPLMRRLVKAIVLSVKTNARAIRPVDSSLSVDLIHP